MGYPQNTSRCPLGNIVAQPLPKWNIFCYCSLIICNGISGPNTLPKWNIFCYCSLIICIGFSGPQHPPNSVIVALLYVLAFQDLTLSQSEIFSVIVAWSYVLAFQDHNTLPKWNIFCYCSFILCTSTGCGLPTKYFLMSFRQYICWAPPKVKNFLLL